MLDWRPIGDGNPGTMTMQLRQDYLETVSGQRPEYDAWLTYVE